MNKFGNIEHMTLQERTDAYTRRRTAEMRGEVHATRLDDRTEKYISRRLAQLRGEGPLRKQPRSILMLNAGLLSCEKRANETKTCRLVDCPASKAPRRASSGDAKT